MFMSSMSMSKMFNVHVHVHEWLILYLAAENRVEMILIEDELIKPSVISIIPSNIL